MEENVASANPIHHTRAGAAQKYSTICFEGWLKLHAESFDVACVIENVNISRVNNLLPSIKYLISRLHVRRMSASSNSFHTSYYYFVLEHVRWRMYHSFVVLEQCSFRLKGKVDVLQFFNSEAICTLFSSVQVEEWKSCLRIREIPNILAN